MTSSFKTILVLTVALHLALLGYLGIGKTPSPAALKSQKVLVNTIRLKPRQEVPEAIACAPKPKPKPPNNKSESKPKPKKSKSESKPPPPPQKNKLSSDQIAKLQKAKNALANMGKIKPTKKQAECAIEGLAIDTSDDRYAGQLSKALKSLLVLPEYGAVKIKLTLTRSGKVKKLEIVGSESKVNEKNIEKTLKNAKFSSFGTHFSGEDQHTFIIVLSNDI